MLSMIIKSLLYGIIEGITEWLPVSSTGHLILIEQLVPFDASDAFIELFNVVIQLGAILAVIVMFFDTLNPFSKKKTQKQQRATWGLWIKVIAAVIPSAVLGLLLDDWLDAHLYHYVPVAIMLVVYGVAFIVVERRNKDKVPAITSTSQLDLKTAMLVGCFQVLALIPGTSRSGATILGAILLGMSRTAGSEFSFFLAIPTMLGASLLKTLKFILEGSSMTGAEWVGLFVGCVSAFLISLLVIKRLLAYVKRHSFSAFGVYRIILGVIVIIYYLIAG